MQEEHRTVVLDADFLSSFLKIGRLDLIRDFFRVEVLHTPVAVFNEISKTKLIKDLLGKKYVHIENVNEKNSANFNKDFENLGSGEKEYIALCKQFQNSLLLTNDKKALDIAKANDITVLNIPAFLLACKNTSFLSTENISQIIKELKEKDYYEFSNEERKRLL